MANPNPVRKLKTLEDLSRISLELNFFFYILPILTHILFIFWLVCDSQKPVFMLKIEILRRLRIRGQIWIFDNFSWFCVIFFGRWRSRILKSSSNPRSTRGLDFFVDIFWKPMTQGTRWNNNQPLRIKKIRVPIASNRALQKIYSIKPKS